jgi:hypothetical protein
MTIMNTIMVMNTIMSMNRQVDTTSMQDIMLLIF